MISLKIHPLDLWQNQSVTDLLTTFYCQNLEKAGINPTLGKDLIKRVWENKITLDKEELRKNCNAVFEKIKSLKVYEPNEIEPLDLLDLSKVSTFLDIGANKLATINYYAEKHPSIQRLIGIDIISKARDFFDPKRCEYYQIDEEVKNFPLKDLSIDFINVQFVFHHFPNLQAIKRMLSICQKIIKPNGYLALWEETFEKNIDSQRLTHENTKIGIKTDSKLTQQFYTLSHPQRWEFISVNDWIINVNNLHMPWTGMYRDRKGWQNLLSEFSFKLDRKYNLGLRINGRLKQGVHMLGIFKKQ